MASLDLNADEATILRAALWDRLTNLRVAASESTRRGLGELASRQLRHAADVQALQRKLDAIYPA